MESIMVVAWYQIYRIVPIVHDFLPSSLYIKYYKTDFFNVLIAER